MYVYIYADNGQRTFTFQVFKDIAQRDRKEARRRESSLILLNIPSKCYMEFILF